MIEFKNVVKSFGERTILKKLSFAVGQGEIVFILGTSGTGKSVSLKCIVGLLKPEEGQVIVDGQNVVPMAEEQLYPVRKKCGMVFQHPALFDSLSIYENIAYGLRKHERWPEDRIGARVKDCLRLVNLKPEILNKKPAQISYGMQKRVSLARTVAIGPKILLFDEPTTGLDPITTNAVNRLIFDLSRELKTTSIVVSHDMHCALEIADRIIVLDKGEIVDQGTPDDLKKSEAPLVRDFLKEALAHVSA